MAIQILPRVKTFGEELGGALGRGAGEAFSDIMSEKRKEKSLKKENEQIKEELGVDLFGVTDPDLRKAYLVEELKGRHREKVEKFKQEGKQKLFKEKQDYVNSLIGGNKNQQGLPGENVPEESDTGNISDVTLAGISAVEPNIARELRAAKNEKLKDIRQKEKIKEQKENALRMETLPIRTRLAENAMAAQRGIESKNKLLELINTGNLDDPTFATLIEQLPFNAGQRLLSPETVEYKGGLVDNYGDLKTLFTGTTRVKEIEILEKKIADIYLTDDQKKRLLASRIEAHKTDLIMAEAAAELESSGKPLGILEYQKQLNKISKDKLEALSNKIIDDQTAIIKQAENRKKIPLDPSDPDDMEIAKQLINEAGGDRKKARELAKKKGYTF